MRLSIPIIETALINGVPGSLEAHAEPDNIRLTVERLACSAERLTVEIDLNRADLEAMLAAYIDPPVSPRGCEHSYTADECPGCRGDYHEE